MKNTDFNQGDIVFMNVDPNKGLEQSGSRPAVVISNNDYQKLMGLCIVCPITNNMKKFPSHVMLDSRTKITGSILCEHVRTVDLEERKTIFKEKLPKDLLYEVLDIVQSFF